MLGPLITTYKRMELDPYLIPYTQVNAKWIVDLTAQVKIEKLLGEKNGSIFIRQSLLKNDNKSIKNKRKNKLRFMNI
jgi:hypothetical protein